MQSDRHHLKLKRAHPAAGKRTLAFSLVELLITVAVIGIIAAIAIPTVGDLGSIAKETKNRNNAQRCASVSATLAGMGVAHVIPQSMGGVEATIRLLREGVTVSHEVMTDSFYSVPNLSNEEIARTSEYLTIVYDTEELRLIYTGESQGEPPVAMTP